MIVPVAWFIYNVHFHPLAGYPGPLMYRGSNIPKVAQQVKGNIANKIHELHLIYGPVVRIGPWELSYITAQAWRDICIGRKGNEPMVLNTIYGQHETELFGALSIL